jgi:AraC-like DNA-binding protein/mannose-6-phosphate isomerase-like protein (cupin superfamily)
MEPHSIPVFTMRDNPDDLPVFIRTYGVDEVTKGLHAHQMIQINYVVAGSVSHQINRSQFIVTEGDAFVIPPQVPHGLVPMETQSFTITELEFNPEFVWGERVPLDQMRGLFDFAYIEPFLVSEKEVKPRLNIPVKDRHMVLEALREIQNEYENRSQGFLLAIKASILRLLVRLGRLYSSEVTNSMESDSLYTEHARSISRALAHIDEHFQKPLDIGQVAKIAILSKSYFCYLFKELTGRTFGEYVKEKRMQYACRQLIETDEKISHIAIQSGYTTVSHFNRVFKDTVGTSPRTYRRMNFYEKR